MIELRRISKTFNRNTANETKALHDVSILIKEKQFVVVLGSNGSGKSSLLNALAGSIRIDEGSIHIDGTDITRMKDYERSKWIARIFQNPLSGTAPDLSILENFRLASLRTRSKNFSIGTNEKFKKKIQDKIVMLNLGLENKLDQQMGSLSGGQRQALTLLMAVMDDTKILLMDEPAAALDPRTSDLLMKLTQKIVDEFHLTVMFITHQLKDALAYGDRLVLMQNGQIQKDLGQSEKPDLQLKELYSWFE
jgi:putative ABC transport system ATP-binding protein